MQPQDVFSFVIYAAIGLYLIVEADSVGQMTGSVRMHRISSTSPGWLIRFFGCMILAAPPGMLVGDALVWWVGVIIGLAAATGIFMLANRLLPL
ncbi:MAG: hypothetical protein R6V07_15540 [Armatimonadota bacterium]